MSALLLALGLAFAADPELALYRSEAARLNGDLNGAWEQAATALDESPEDWRAHLAWQDALATAPWWLDAEYAALAATDDPELQLLAAWWAARGGAPLEVPADANPTLQAEVVARYCLDRGDPKAALSALGQLSTPEASKLRMEAYFELGESGSLRREAREAQRSWPERPDLLVWLIRDDSAVGKPQRSRTISQTANLSTSSDPVLVYRAHALFVAAGQQSLAEATAARLAALGEPYPVPSRALWKPAMVRDLGRVLALQKIPAVPPGGVPDETQRVLVAAAVTVENKGQPERAAELWRIALAADEPDCLTTMHAAESLRRAGAPPDELLGLVRQARERCAVEADPGPAGTAARGASVDSWMMEAEILRSKGALEQATVAARTAVDLGADANGLVLLGQILEARGETKAALLAYAQAAAAGAPNMQESLDRLYGGPADARALVDAVGELVPELPQAPPPTPTARFPVTQLQTSQGPVKVGEGGYVLVAFWASWCGPCGEELPALDRWTDRISAENLPFTVVAVSVDDAEAHMARYLRNHTLSHLAVSWNPELGRQLGVEGIPTTILIGPDGQVIARHQGYSPGDVDRLDAELRRALADQKP